MTPLFPLRVVTPYGSHYRIFQGGTFFFPLKSIRFAVTTYTHYVKQFRMVSLYNIHLNYRRCTLLSLFYREENRGCQGLSVFVIQPISMHPELIVCKTCTTFNWYSACFCPSAGHSKGSCPVKMCGVAGSVVQQNFLELSFSFPPFFISRCLS